MSNQLTTASISKKRHIDQIRRALGDTVNAALDADDVSDIMVNEDGSVWVERLGGSMEIEGQVEPEQLTIAINALATFYDTVCRPDNPILSCELPGEGSRVEANVPPVVRAPTLSIRKKALKIMSLQDYVDSGSLSQNYKERIEKAVSDHENIIIAGGTGTGKTTLVNAVITAMVEFDPSERLFILEDTPEIQCSAPNKVIKLSNDTTGLLALLRSGLRQRPNRILVGEVRGAVAWELLKAWNTGHPGGVCTLHADADPKTTGKAGAALKRLEQLAAENPDCPTQTEVLREAIAESVGIIVYITRKGVGGKRVVSAVVEVSDYNKNGYDLNVVS